MRPGASPRTIHIAQLGGTALFVFVLLTWVGLLVGAVLMVIDQNYGGAIALGLVCNAMATLGQYSEAWNLRISSPRAAPAQDAPHH